MRDRGDLGPTLLCHGFNCKSVVPANSTETSNLERVSEFRVAKHEVGGESLNLNSNRGSGRLVHSHEHGVEWVVNKEARSPARTLEK